MAATKSKKIDPLVEAFLQVERFGTKGMPVCAPSSLKDKVPALKYTSSGKLGANDKFNKLDIFDYLEESDSKEFEVTARKKIKKITVTNYRLSSRGKAYLSEYRLGQKMEQKKRLASLDGIQEVIEQNTVQRKELVKEVRSVTKAPQELQEQIKSDVSDIRKEMLQQIESINKDFRTTVGCLENSLKGVLADLEKKIAGIEETLTKKAQGLEESLQQKTNLQLQVELDRYWDSHSSHVDYLQQKISEYSEEEKFLSVALQDKMREERAKILGESAKEIESFEKTVIEKILEQLSSEELDSIPEIYKKVVDTGVNIQPGHFNDLLWQLAKEEKIALRAWDRSLSYLPNPEHAIIRKEILFYAKNLTKS